MTQVSIPVQRRRRIKVQWVPNLIRDERRIVLTRVYWNRGNVGDGKGVSNKLSVSLCWAWYDLWVGLFVAHKPRTEPDDTFVWLCLLPCLPIRFHWKRSWGGRFF